MLWVLKTTSRLDDSFEQPKHMLKLMDKEKNMISHSKSLLNSMSFCTHCILHFINNVGQPRLS